jgi:hypothetical protein
MNSKNEQFEHLYEFIHEIMETTDDIIDKWIHDLEIELEYEMREEIEKKYGKPWWQVLNPMGKNEKDEWVEINEEENPNGELQNS